MPTQYPGLQNMHRKSRTMQTNQSNRVTALAHSHSPTHPKARHMGAQLTLLRSLHPCPSNL